MLLLTIKLPVQSAIEQAHNRGYHRIRRALALAAKARLVSMVFKAVLHACVARWNVLAELPLFRQAGAEELDTQLNIVRVLDVRPKHLLLALPRHLQVPCATVGMPPCCVTSACNHLHAGQSHAWR